MSLPLHHAKQYFSKHYNKYKKDASYEKFHMSHFQAKVSFDKGVLKAKEVQLKSMSGNITGDLALSQTEEGNLRLITSSKLDQINVRQPL